MFSLFILSFLMSGLALIFLFPISKHVGLTDKPCARKQHTGHIPLIGGLAVFLSIFTILSFYPNLIEHSPTYLFCSSLLIFIGIVDDKLDVSAGVRLLILIGLSVWLVLIAEFKIHYLGDLMGFGNILLSHGGLLFTIIAIIGAVTAFNMVDGLDGLLGGLSSVTLLALSILFWNNDQINLAIFCIVVICAIIPYIICNLELSNSIKMKVFMGDSGSLFIGFTVVWLLIEGSQTHAGHVIQNKINPVTALWVIAIPLMDMATTMLRRIKKRQSPLKADREHIHHICERMGLSSRETLLSVSALAAFFAAIGVIGELLEIAEVIMFSLFLLAFVGYWFWVSHIWKITVWVRKFRGSSRLKASVTK